MDAVSYNNQQLEEKQETTKLNKRKRTTLDAVSTHALNVGEKHKTTKPSAGPRVIKIHDDLHIFYAEVGQRSNHPNNKLRTLRISDPKVVNLNNLLRTRKLVLVLDLDHTLLHSVFFGKLTPEERLLYAADKDNSVIRLAKLRPFVHSFLKQASQLFEMFICTMANRSYALAMARLIDPDNVYFDNYSRITTIEDFPVRNRKSLHVIMGKENERAVVILDDSEDVWENNKRNLIVPQSYNYFAAEKDKRLSPNSHSVLKTDENQRPGTLATALEVLRCIHGEFFDVPDQDEGLAHQDVRRVIDMMVGESNSEKTLRF